MPLGCTVLTRKSDQYRVIEDGVTTQYRLAAIEGLLPGKTDGPVFHFHEMHDEGFYITVSASADSSLGFADHRSQKGAVRFHCPGRPPIDAKEGDLVTIPIRIPHKFSNPFDEEARFINTITPGFFVRYFEHLEQLIGKGVVLTPEVNRAALMRFATVPLSPPEAIELETTLNAPEGTAVPHSNGTKENEAIVNEKIQVEVATEERVPVKKEVEMTDLGAPLLNGSTPKEWITHEGAQDKTAAEEIVSAIQGLREPGPGAISNGKHVDETVTKEAAPIDAESNGIHL